jgi:hypothetical protein
MIFSRKKMIKIHIDILSFFDIVYRAADKLYSLRFQMNEFNILT